MLKYRNVDVLIKVLDPTILTLVGLAKEKDIRSEYVYYIFLRKHKHVQNLRYFMGALKLDIYRLNILLYTFFLS